VPFCANTLEVRVESIDTNTAGPLSCTCVAAWFALTCGDCPVGTFGMSWTPTVVLDGCENSDDSSAATLELAACGLAKGKKDCCSVLS
jgi:hypothetical protein